MPELPEVHTTVNGLQKVLPKLIITDIWSDMWSSSKLAHNTIKDKTYFPYFKKYVLNRKIISVARRAKYILINLDNGFTMIIHMKMTGHLMVGKYIFRGVRTPRSVYAKRGSWKPIVADLAGRGQTSQTKTHPLLDPYNRHIHVVFTLSNGKHLVFCDSRKFGTIVVEKTSTIHTERLKHLGPEPLEKTFTENNFKERILLSPKRAIKTVLMDQTIIAGIGNIYSDEMLHIAHIKPTRIPKGLKKTELALLFKSMKKVLSKGIDFGGDSMSDYRNIDGVRGKFQEKHKVYLRTGRPCVSRRCKGIIKKEKVGGRSAHYCPKCQK